MVQDEVTGEHASLRDVFAGELAKRLPRLVAWNDGVADDVEAAVRDAHTLATSAILVGEPEISRLARGAEYGDAQMLAALVPLLQAWAP
ncbi:MAG: hypothetical protein JWO12_2096 [Frankiales bacterium]|nr:hypothetical protein [Frankiales bacterium]